jgi:DNA-binding XRE family transcriptional regulator
MTTDAADKPVSRNLIRVRRLLAEHPGSTATELELAQGTASRRGRLNQHEIQLGLRALCRKGQARCEDIWDGPWWPLGAPMASDLKAYLMSESRSAILAKRLRTARVNGQFSQQDVADVLGLSRSAVSQIENGRRAVKGPELRALAELYGRRLSAFIRSEPDA